jgi:hypothetical protein
MHFSPLACSNFGTFDDEAIYTVREVADDILECEIGHVYDLISKGRLEAANIGLGTKRIYRIRASAIRAFFAAGEEETAKRTKPSAPSLDAVSARHSRRRKIVNPPSAKATGHQESRIEMVRRLKGRS